MRDLLSDDGRYWAVQQDDSNFVVYRKSDMTPVWDKWSYEAANGVQPVVPVSPDPQPEEEYHPPSPINVDRTPVLVRSNVNPIGMAYWRNINQHRNQEFLDVILADPNDSLVLLTLAKSNLQVINERRLGIFHTGEGIHFSAHNPYELFVPYHDKLVKFNTVTMKQEVMWEAPAYQHLWQCHVNFTEDVFSASIQDDSWKIIKWGVYYRGVYKAYELKGSPDECQIDKSGEYLLIKEEDYNRVIRLADGDEKYIMNNEGALGHSDCGFECALGENDMSAFGGALDLIDFSNGLSVNIFHTSVWNMGYFSFSNAKPGDRNRQYGVLSSSDNRLIQVKLDGQSRVICDLKTQSQEYENRSKANLCPNGEFAIWTALVNGQRCAYIVRVPSF